MQYTRGERFFLWLERRSPRVLMEQPERVLINSACILIGLSAMLPPVGRSVLSHWPDWGRYGWGIVMIFGAVCSLYGATKLSRSADRIGALALILGSSFLAVDIIGVLGNRALITATIFFGITGAKAARFVRSTAVRIRVRHNLVELKERREKDG